MGDGRDGEAGALLHFAWDDEVFEEHLLLRIGGVGRGKHFQSVRRGAPCRGDSVAGGFIAIAQEQDAIEGVCRQRLRGCEQGALDGGLAGRRRAGDRMLKLWCGGERGERVVRRGKGVEADAGLGWECRREPAPLVGQLHGGGFSH